MPRPDPEFSPSPAHQPHRRALRKQMVLLGLCVVLLLLATIPPLINLGRFQRRIAVAISRSIGRTVGMDSIALRLLPWPAFKIDNLTVGEDPAFGAEPSLLAPEVIVEPRLSSLWRGRFELSRVELTDASVNLVRRADGRWNISSVLLQASHIPNAPTAQKTPGQAPRFPYIEATGTRVNIKRGMEKLPYSLLNADFSMYLARPDVWQLKLEGQPVRTDLDLSLDDTGLVHIEGELHRASALGTMPLAMTGEWSHAPLGQLSRLLLGRDAGWRGDIDATAQVKGEVDHLDTRVHLVILNLHRQEFTPDQPFTVDATCTAHSSRATPQDDALHCRWPVGTGALTLAAIRAEAGAQSVLSANEVPAAFFASALGLVHPGTPSASRFTGDVSGSFGYDSTSGALTGDAALPVLAVAGAGEDGTPLTIKGIAAHAVPGPLPSLAVTTEPLDLGATLGTEVGAARSPLTLSAELTRLGYTFHASGGATVPALSAVAGGLRLPALADFSSFGAAPATAQVALTASGGWSGSDAPEGARAVGSIRLENVLWSPKWLRTPVHFATANASVAPGIVRWSTPGASFTSHGMLVRFAGEAAVPMDCATRQACRAQFSLRTDTLDAQMLASALSAPTPMLSALIRRMDRIGQTNQTEQTGQAETGLVPNVEGTVRAGVFTLGKLSIHDASAVITTDLPAPATVRVRNLDGHALGGTLHLEGTVSAADGNPRYTVRLLAAGVSAPAAAALWHESWGPGTLGGTAELSLSGKSQAALLDSIKGSFHLSWLHGGAGSPLAPAIPAFASWDGSGTFGPAGLALTRSTLSGTPASASGSVGFDRTLTLDLIDPAERRVLITGTLAAPEETKASSPAE